MKKTILLLALIVCFACEKPVEFGAENPFAVMAKKYRDPNEAILAKQRLEEMGLEPYLIHFAEENGGRWHGVFLGAFPTLESMMKGKIDYEDQYGLKKIDRINFNQLSQQIIAFDYERFGEGLVPYEELGEENTKKFQSLPQEFQKLISVLPFDKELKLRKLKMLSALDQDVLRSQAITRLGFDWPRGISPIRMYKNSSALLEAHYQDEILGDHFFMQVVKVIKKNPFGEAPATHFADAILGTREYKLEEKQALNIAGWEAVLATISPKEGQIMNYVMLYRAQDQLLCIIQAREKFFPLEKVKAFCARFGKASLTANYQLYGALEKFPQKDTLIALSVETLKEVKLRNKLLWEGSYQSKYWLNSMETGVWQATNTKFFDAINAQELFSKTYAPTKRSKPDTLALAKGKALLYTERRNSKENRRKVVRLPRAIYWQAGSSIREISNRKKAWLTEEDVKQRADAWKE